LALLGGVTFILAFALQSNLGNLASGLMIMVYKPFDVSDEVKIGSLWGKVETITLANTRIKGLDGQMFSIPNSKVWSDTVENLSHGKARKISLPIRVGFDQDLRRVEQILVETMKSHPKVLENPAPTTSIKRLEDYYIPVGASAWTQQENYWEVLSDLVRMVQERFRKEGIEFAAVPKVINVNQEPHADNSKSQLIETSTHSVNSGLEGSIDVGNITLPKRVEVR
jgi:small conductance mechanosensitive channel